MACTEHGASTKARRCCAKRFPWRGASSEKPTSDTIRLRWSYGLFLFRSPDATLDDIREAVATMEETYGTVERVFGAEHSYTREMDPKDIRFAQAELRAREGKWRGISEALGYVMDPEDPAVRRRTSFKFNFKLL